MSTKELEMMLDEDLNLQSVKTTENDIQKQIEKEKVKNKALEKLRYLE